MKLHQIAFAAAAALIGSQASALSITDTNASGTVKVYASGASAVSNVLAGVFVHCPAARAGTGAPRASAAPAASSRRRSWRWPSQRR